MLDTSAIRAGAAARDRKSRGWVDRTMVAAALLFVGIFLVLPLANVLYQAFREGLPAYWRALTEPDTVAAIRLTLAVAAVAVPLNTLIGVAAAWAVTKFDFPAKSLLLTLIDLPFSVAPVVAGLLLVLLFGSQGFWGPWLRDHGVRIVFATPGIILATVFVTFPFVARELIPLMEAQGSDQEQAALTLGASGWQTFRRVTLPSVRYGLLYGVVLCSARAMGEFGAVSVVSGHVTGESDTVPLRIEKLYQEYHSSASFAVASLLVFAALITLGVKSWFEERQDRGHALGQQAQWNSREH